MDMTPAAMNDSVRGTLAELFGMRFIETSAERVVAELTIRDDLRTVGGALHGGTLMAFADTVGAAAKRLKLVQVPGAGLDRIDRAAIPAHAWLANAYGHEVGIAEYIVGAMLALTREFGRLDAAFRRGVWDSQWAIGATSPALW